MKPQEIVIRVVLEVDGKTSAFTIPSDKEFEEVRGKDHTPSQRLRLALMNRYARTHDGNKMPEEWYETQMGRIITAIQGN